MQPQAVLLNNTPFIGEISSVFTPVIQLIHSILTWKYLSFVDMIARLTIVLTKVTI